MKEIVGTEKKKKNTEPNKHPRSPESFDELGLNVGLLLVVS